MLSHDMIATSGVDITHAADRWRVNTTFLGLRLEGVLEWYEDPTLCG